MSIKRQKDELGYVHTMEYSSVRKRKDLLICAAKQMHLKSIMPNEKSQIYMPRNLNSIQFHIQ